MEVTQLGKYRLLDLLATGGMGEVYLAKMEGPAGFSKTVVVKRVLSHLARSPDFVEMFLNEARLAAVLSHPNIVQIFELGEQSGSYFIAMEFVNGRSLKAVKQRLLEHKQVVSPIFAARVCAQALNGLHYAHTLKDDSGRPLNVVHRDMSPDNVLVSFAGEVKLVDFGIAKASNTVTTTRTGTLKGKYSYMAPEQLLAQPVDARTDIFAMGIVLYELLTGVRPFRGGTEPALIQNILHGEPKPPHEVNPNVPPELSDIVLAAIQKQPKDRFQSAEEMSSALESWISSTGQPLTASHVGSLLKTLFPDWDKLPASLSTGSNPSVKAVSAPVEETRTSEATVMLPSGHGSAPSLVKPAPKGTSSPSLLNVPSIGPSPRKVLVIASAAGAGVGLIVAAAFLFMRQPQVVVVTEKAPPVAVQQQPPVNPVAPEPVKAIEPPVEAKNEPKHEETPPPEKTEVKHAVASGKGETRKVVAKNGKVSLRVNPYAEVFFGGKSLGVTPMPPVEVPSGTQTFTLKNPELKITKQVSVKVPPGGTVVLKADLFDG